jgi:hypothetical protein
MQGQHRPSRFLAIPKRRRPNKTRRHPRSRLPVRLLLEILEDRITPSTLGVLQTDLPLLPGHVYTSGGYSAALLASPKFEDISHDSGAVAILRQVDDTVAQAPIGFNFPFFGQRYDAVWISDNGLMSFKTFPTDGGYTTYAGSDLTQNAGPNRPIIAPLWDDWVTNLSDNQAVYYETLGTPGNQRFVVQWDHLAGFPGSLPTFTFEVALFDNGRIEFRYDNVASGDGTSGYFRDFGENATIGIRSGFPEVRPGSMIAGGDHEGEGQGEGHGLPKGVAGIQISAAGASEGQPVIQNDSTILFQPNSLGPLYPAPTAIALDNASLNEGQPAGTILGTLSTTDSGGDGSFTYSLVSGPGDTNNGQFTVVGNQLQTTAVLESGVNSQLSVRVQTQDSNLQTFAEALTITVNDVPPAATITGVPDLAPQGSTITLGSTLSDPGDPSGAGAATYQWSVSHNGQAVTDAFATPTDQAGFSFVPADDGVYTVNLTVSDPLEPDATASADITVTPVPPTVAIIKTGPDTPLEGTRVKFDSGVSEPGNAAGSVQFVYQWSVTHNGQIIDPGTPTTGSSFSFTPQDNGAYSVSLSVTDNSDTVLTPDSTGTQSTTINVNAVPPTILLTDASGLNPAPTTGVEGGAVALGSRVTDPTAASHFVYQWSVIHNGQTIDRGTPTTDPTFSFTPHDDGPYSLSLTVTDTGDSVVTGDSTATVTTTVNVIEVSPTVAITGVPATPEQGSPIALGSAVSDPGHPGSPPNVGFSWSVIHNNARFTISGPTNGSTFTFTPWDDGDYTVQLTVSKLGELIQTDAGTVTTEVALHVAQAAPVVAITGAPASSPEMTPITLGSTAADPGDQHGTANVSYQWSVTGLLAGSPSLSVTNASSFTFVPATVGTYVVTLTVTDQGDSVSTPAGTVVETVTINVTNVPPVVNVGTDNTFTGANAVWTRTIGFTSPDSSWTVSVDYGNGDTETFALPPVGNNTHNFNPADKTFTLQKAYSTAQTFTVTVTITDNQGGLSDPASFAVSVFDVQAAAHITSFAVAVVGASGTASTTLTDPTGNTKLAATINNGKPGDSISLTVYSSNPVVDRSDSGGQVDIGATIPTNTGTSTAGAAVPVAFVDTRVHADSNAIVVLSYDFVVPNSITAKNLQLFWWNVNLHLWDKVNADSVAGDDVSFTEILDAHGHPTGMTDVHFSRTYGANTNPTVAELNGTVFSVAVPVSGGSGSSTTTIVPATTLASLSSTPNTSVEIRTTGFGSGSSLSLPAQESQTGLALNTQGAAPAAVATVGEQQPVAGSGNAPAPATGTILQQILDPEFWRARMRVAVPTPAQEAPPVPAPQSPDENAPAPGERGEHAHAVDVVFAGPALFDLCAEGDLPDPPGSQTGKLHPMLALATALAGTLAAPGLERLHSRAGKPKPRRKSSGKLRLDTRGEP